MRAYLLLLGTIGGLGWCLAPPPQPPARTITAANVRVGESFTIEVKLLDFSKLNDVPFEVGDWVPCPDDRGEWILNVEARYEGNLLYLREQSFCRYDGKNVDPSKEPGMRKNVISHSLMGNGACCGGTDYFADLTADAVALRVEWSISHDKRSTPYIATLPMKVGEFGTRDLGGGRTLHWAFVPPLESPRIE